MVVPQLLRGNRCKERPPRLPQILEEEVKRLVTTGNIAEARYFKHPECENYCSKIPEPTDEQYAQYVQYEQVKRQLEDNSFLN